MNIKRVKSSVKVLQCKRETYKQGGSGRASIFTMEREDELCFVAKFFSWAKENSKYAQCFCEITESHIKMDISNYCLIGFE